MTTYVAVGFKVSRDRSIFYYKNVSLERFIDHLETLISKYNPDFVSLRMVK